MKTLNLVDLVGKHILSGVDISSEDIKIYSTYEHVNTIKFTLDNVTYKVTEYPDDGYRSHMREIFICNESVSNKFVAHEVIGKMKGSSKYENCEIIQFFDTSTEKVVLEIGTDNSDDYYPSFVMRFNPENLDINVSVSKYNL